MEHRITINGQQKTVLADKLTYEQIVAMVYQATVTYSVAQTTAKGTRVVSHGLLHGGQSVEVEDGMTINCMVTGSA